LRASGTANDLKRALQPRLGISGRQFNALRAGLDGKVSSVKERRPGLIADAEARIRCADKVIAKRKKKAPGSNKLHQKKRRLETLRARLVRQKADHQDGKVRWCFGSQRLFHAPFDLEANGYADHAPWKADWQKARSDQFFVLGSKDETAGCQGCQASIEEDGSLTLSLRLPEGLSPFGKHIEIASVCFTYGHEAIVAALQSSQRLSAQTKQGKEITKRTGSALSERFVRDAKGCTVFVSIEVRPVAVVSHRGLGAIGIDINADHLAVSATERCGKLIGSRRVTRSTYGKNSDQAKALIGDAAVDVAAQAKSANKPLVIERLDFQKRKADLETVDPPQARMISASAYTKVISGI